MLKPIKNFILSEDGSLIEKLAEILILGLGSTAIYFGVLTALRQKGGELIDTINTMDF